MNIFAQSTLDKALILSDGFKLGKIENFIFNKMTKDVDLLVMPELAPKLIRTHAGNIVGMMASQAMGRIKDVVPIEIVAPIGGALGGPTGGMIATDVKKRLKVIEESYYLIPTYFVDSVDSDSLHVALRKEQCHEWFLTPNTPPEIYAAFYDSSHYRGQKRSFDIDIGLPSIYDRMTTGEIRDGKEYLVRDMRIDTSSGKGILLDS